MEFFPAPLENLVEQFARLPGIGSKSAQRLAFHVLNLPQDQARAFSAAAKISSGVKPLLDSSPPIFTSSRIFCTSSSFSAVFSISASNASLPTD